MKKIFTLCSLFFALNSCNEIDFKGFLFPPSDDVEKRFAQSIEWNGSQPGIVIPVAADDYNFYGCSDIHVAKTTGNLQKFVNISQNDMRAAFALFNGDLIDEKGAFAKFVTVFVDTIKPNPLRFFATIGNHDLFFEQWNDYKAYFHTSTYTFIVKTPNCEDLYIALDSGSGTLGKSQLQWLKNQLKNRKNYRHCIIFTHTNIFATDNSQTTSGNLALEETYELMDLFSRYSVDLVVTGHDHFYGIDIFDSVTYLTASVMKDGETNAGYLIIEIAKKIRWEDVKIYR
jgi:predicted phosphodiesterase